MVGEEPFNVVAPANFLDWQKQARSFEQMAASGETAFNLASATGSFTPERIDGSYCSANLFDTLGVNAGCWDDRFAAMKTGPAPRAWR